MCRISLPSFLFAVILKLPCSITAILVSRFLIDLQEANRKAVDHTSFANTTSTLRADTTLHFANFVNSFGASIAVPGVEEDEDTPEVTETDKSTEDGGSSPEHPIAG